MPLTEVVWLQLAMQVFGGAHGTPISGNGGLYRVQTSITARQPYLILPTVFW